MNSYYPIFCVASRILQQERYACLDEAWDKAHSLYQDFLDSEFNDPNQSELDCIHAFMDKVYSSTPPDTIVVDVAYIVNDDGTEEYDIEGMTEEFTNKLKYYEIPKNK